VGETYIGQDRQSTKNTEAVQVSVPEDWDKDIGIFEQNDWSEKLFKGQLS
jgi:hypothetical protein